MKHLFVLLAFLLLPLSVTAQIRLFQGGTGLSTSTVGDLMFGTSSVQQYSRLTIGTGGYILASIGGTPQWVATTTFASPLSYSAGQVSCPTCSTGLTGGSPNTLTYWTSASAVSATSSPTVGNVYATTTTATSTFLGGLTIGNPTTGFNVTPNGSTTIGAATGVGVLEVQGIDSLSTNSRLVQLGVYNTGTQLVDRGGVMALGGISGTTLTSYGAIAGRKENSTGGNTQGYMSFFTRPNSGAMTVERARFTSQGTLSIGSSTPSASSTLIVVPTTGINGNSGLATTTLTVGTPALRFCLETWDNVGTRVYVTIQANAFLLSATSCK